MIKVISADGENTRMPSCARWLDSDSSLSADLKLLFSSLYSKIVFSFRNVYYLLARLYEISPCSAEPRYVLLL